MPDEYKMPRPQIGDMVYWHHDALSGSNPTLGWVVEDPGVNTITVMTVSSFAGLQFRPSVRHREDPGLQDNAEWRQWGSWEFAPITKSLRKLDQVMPDMIAFRERMGKPVHAKA